MKFGLGVNTNETVSEIVKKCVLAEHLGIDYVWVSDTPTQLYAPAVAAAIAENTQRIKIGLGLISAFLHTPNHIAQSMLTLLQTYRERFELCIGPGDRILLEKAGVSMSYPEGVLIYFRNAKHQIETSLKASGVTCKLWLGAQGPKMLETAGLYDGVLLNYASPDAVQWAIERVKRKTRNTPEFGIYAPSYVYSRFDPEVRQLLRISGTVVALGASKTILKRLNLYSSVGEARRRLGQGATMKSTLDHVPEQAIKPFTIMKSSDELEGYLTELSQIGIQHVVFSYPQNHSEKTIRDLGLALRRNAKHKSR